MNTVKSNRSKDTGKKQEATPAVKKSQAQKSVAPSPVKTKAAPVNKERPAVKKPHVPVTLKPASPAAVDEKLKASQPVENDYEAHQKDPAPSKEAVFEEDEDGAGKAMKWVIPAVVAGLVILWFFMK